MDQQDLLSRIKQIPITSYLLNIGIQPQKISGQQFVYFSPFREEKTPSFYVNPQKNVFNDFSSSERGDIIRLARLIHKCSFSEAITILEKVTLAENRPSFSFSGNHSKKANIEVTSVKHLENKTLQQYVLSRKIDLTLAAIYLQEANFTIHDKSYFALCFRNSKGGYELRNKGFKGSSSPKYYTLIAIPGSKNINVFEGFMDFLSALMYFKVEKPTHTTLILNSLTLLDQALPEIIRYKKVNAFLDNDAAGGKALKKLNNAHLNIIDNSFIYVGYKDFNEFLVEGQ
jgi:DNA primase